MKIVLFSLIGLVSLFLGTSFQQGFSELENTYVSEKCGVSIQYPKDWTVTESDYVYEDFSKTIAEFQSDEDDIVSLDFAIYNYEISDNSIENIAEQEKYNIDYPEISIIQSGITTINRLPTFKMTYI
jgi:hypothetical protein